MLSALYSAVPSGVEAYLGIDAVFKECVLVFVVHFVIILLI